MGDTAEVKKPDNDFIAINKVNQLDRLEMFLYGREYNFVHSDRVDKKGSPMIGLLLRQLGKRDQKKGLIVCLNDDVKTAALQMINAKKVGGSDEK